MIQYICLLTKQTPFSDARKTQICDFGTRPVFTVQSLSLKAKVCSSCNLLGIGRPAPRRPQPVALSPSPP